MRWRWLLPFLPTACSLATNLDDLGNPGGADASNDVTTDVAPEATVDAATDAESDASRDVSADAGSLLANGSFEQTGVGCGPGWTAIGGTGTPIIHAAPVAFDGTLSCEICATAKTLPGILADIYQTLTVPVAIGDDYGAQVYVRDTLDDAAPPDFAQIILQELGADGGQVGSMTSGRVVPNGTWQPINTSLLATQPGTQLRLYIELSADAGAGQCALVDDAILVKQ